MTDLIARLTDPAAPATGLRAEAAERLRCMETALRTVAPEVGPCEACGGHVMRSQNDATDPYLYCSDCEWQGEDDFATKIASAFAND